MIFKIGILKDFAKFKGSESLFNRISVFERVTSLKMTPEQAFSCNYYEVTEILNRNVAYHNNKNIYI